MKKGNNSKIKSKIEKSKRYHFEISIYRYLLSMLKYQPSMLNNEVATDKQTHTHTKHTYRAKTEEIFLLPYIFYFHLNRWFTITDCNWSN